jgi:hypothetical protein
MWNTHTLPNLLILKNIMSLFALQRTELRELGIKRQAGLNLKNKWTLA